METKNIVISVAIGVALLCVGLLFGGKFGSTSFVCNGGTVSGGSTSVPQGSVSLATGGGDTGLKFGATSGTESFSQAGSNFVTGNTTTTLANTTGNILNVSRTSATSSFDLATTGTCMTVKTNVGGLLYITFGVNGMVTSTSVGCQ